MSQLCVWHTVPRYHNFVSGVSEVSLVATVGNGRIAVTLTFILCHRCQPRSRSNARILPTPATGRAPGGHREYIGPNQRLGYCTSVDGTRTTAGGQVRRAAEARVWPSSGQRANMRLLVVTAVLLAAQVSAATTLIDDDTEPASDDSASSALAGSQQLQDGLLAPQLGHTIAEHRPPVRSVRPADPRFSLYGQAADRSRYRAQPGYEHPGYDRTAPIERPGYQRSNYDRIAANERPGYDRTPANERPQYERPSYDRSPANERPDYRTTSIARPSYDSRSYGRRPGYNRTVSNERPGYDRSGHVRRPTNERPWYDRTAANERPGYDRTVAYERQGYDRTVANERPGYDRTVTNERPGYDRSVVNERPGYDRSVANERPGYDRTAPNERPGYDRTAPNERLGYDRTAPNERPGYDRTAPNERPGYSRSWLNVQDGAGYREEVSAGSVSGRRMEEAFSTGERQTTYQTGQQYVYLYRGEAATTTAGNHQESSINVAARVIVTVGTSPCDLRLQVPSLEVEGDSTWFKEAVQTHDLYFRPNDIRSSFTNQGRGVWQHCRKGNTLADAT
ncbi:Serum response factor-binding protein 1 [Portunus trituberculatus]|uniref:Serum response factor-binding protein 1 n=1 Tax=Portunus trituberculatus TaxID=210409 RepID=A0A5B7F4U4_PORTR|nr:Serum response factor-binding protein 1 [Portunus trituberculatus]